VYPGESHAGLLTNGTAVPDLLEWMQARFADAPAPDDCPATIDELLATDQPLNIAHAGGDQDAPHSTLFAFGEAARAGADVLELDVQLTADHVLVVQHDATVDKTTEATGAVIDLTFAELDALDNAYWFSPECWPCQDRPVAEYIYRGIRTGVVAAPDGYTADDFSVATLREVARRFPSLPLDIEIKGEGDAAIAVANALAAELEALGRLGSTVVVSFDDDVVDAFHAAAPDVSVSPGTDRLAAWLLTNTPLDGHFRLIQIPPFARGLEVASADNIARAHDEGLDVWVWPDDASTQENTAFYAELIGRSADGVIAGRPASMEAASQGEAG
jgi:glycerophosphoryl diester phosphodiesterase